MPRCFTALRVVATGRFGAASASAKISKARLIETLRKASEVGASLLPACDAFFELECMEKIIGAVNRDQRGTRCRDSGRHHEAGSALPAGWGQTRQADFLVGKEKVKGKEIIEIKHIEGKIDEE